MFSLCPLHFLHFRNAIGGMQLICYKCFGTLNEGMEFLEFNLNLSFTFYLRTCVCV